MYRILPLTWQEELQLQLITKSTPNAKEALRILHSITKMAQLHPYSIAELSRCKLLHEASVKDRDLRRLVGHVNMYDKLLDVLNSEEARERAKSPPKSIKTESNIEAEHRRDARVAKKDKEAFEYSVHYENDSVRGQEDCNAVSVAEIEILDDDD
jgi:hypothetical protein